MRTILTIDFDILMHNSIELYNNHSSGDVNTFIQDFPFLSYLPIDLEFYFNILTFITHFDSNKIIFINDHQEVIDYVPENEKVHLINIDHHHDVNYDNDNWDEEIETLNCGNWVKALWDKGALEDYTWIADNKSLFPPPEAIHYITKQKYIDDLDLEESFIDVDLIIICLSPEWIPEYYIPLYDTLQYLIDYKERI